MISNTFKHYESNIKNITHETINMLSHISSIIFPNTSNILEPPLEPPFELAHKIISSNILLDDLLNYLNKMNRWRKLNNESKAERIIRYLYDFVYYTCVLKHRIINYKINFSIINLKYKSSYDKELSRLGKGLSFIINNLNQELQSYLTRIISYTTTPRDILLLNIQEWLLFRSKIILISKKSKMLLEEIMTDIPINNKPVAYLLNKKFPIDIHNTKHNILLYRLIFKKY